MKLFLSAVLAAAVSMALAQTHESQPADSIKGIGFLAGDWSGKQNFNNPGGGSLVADIQYHAHFVVGGRFLEEVLNTTIPGKPPTDVRHMIGYDPKTQTYHAWWFNDTSAVPMELVGKLDGNQLVLQTPESPNARAIFKATYERVPATSELKYKLEMKAGNDWRELFHNTYRNGASAAK